MKKKSIPYLANFMLVEKHVYFTKAVAWFSYAANLPAAYVNFYLPHNLSQVLTAGLPAKLSLVQRRRQAGDCWRWKHFMWASSTEICDAPRYAATKRQVGRRHMRTKLKTVFETGNSHNSEYELREEVSKITNKLQL